MNARVALLVAKKELRELVRDRRTLLFLVVLPVLLYPLLMLALARAGQAGMESLEAKTVVVAVAADVPYDVAGALRGLDRVRVVAVDEQADAVVRLAPPAVPDARAPVVVELDRATEKAAVVEDRVVGALRAAREAARDDRLAAHGVPPEDLVVPDVLVVDTSTREARGGFVFGRVVAPLLVFMLIMGAFTPASDATAGERERQTLRTLLCAPVDARSVALGKLLSTTIVALGAALANLGGLALTLRSGLGQGVTLHVGVLDVLPILIVLIPTAAYVAALLLAGSAFARTTKEAQALLTPIVLVVAMPAFGVSLPGVPASPALALVPVFGPALVLREVFAGTATPLLLLAGAGGAVALVVVALGLAARAFTVEALMSGRVAAPLRAPGPLPAFDGVLVVMAVFFAAVVISSAAAGAGVVPLLIATQLGVFVLVPLAFVAARSTTPIDALGLGAPRRPGALLVVAGAVLLVPSLLAVTERAARALLDVDDAALEQLEQLAAGLADLPVPLLIVLVAVLPAVCEEICFRGAILRAWRARPVVAVVASAVLFAALHGSLARVPPTLALGLLAGFVAVRTGSTWAAVLVHATHNGTALAVPLLSGDGLDVEAALRAADAPLLPPLVHVAIVPGLVLLALGLRRGARSAPSAPPGLGP